MPIVVLVLALLAYGYLLLAFPEYRRAALALGAVVAAAVGAAVWLDDPEPRRPAPLIPPAEIEITAVTVAPTIRGAALSGQVLNRSAAHALHELTIALAVFDCPNPAAPTPACRLSGESTAIARPDAAPGEAQPFQASFIFRPVPTVAGEARYEWRLVEARAPR